MELVIVTGVSGAGKTRAVGALEDIGFYCVDNIPPRMLTQFAQLDGGEATRRMAVVVDARSHRMLAEFEQGLRELEVTGQAYRVLYLDASDEILIRRFSETRRRHPLLGEGVDTLEHALTLERELLAPARDRADYVVDTTHLSNAQLRERIGQLFLESLSDGLTVACFSFGFKYGPPADADLVFDLRCLPNPFYIPELRPLSGTDAAVRDYVLGSEQAQGLLTRLFDLLDYLLPLYTAEGKSRLTIALGCTGGQHRSVAFAEAIAAHLKGRTYRVTLYHRDSARWAH